MSALVIIVSCTVLAVYWTSRTRIQLNGSLAGDLLLGRRLSDGTAVVCDADVDGRIIGRYQDRSIVPGEITAPATTDSAMGRVFPSPCAMLETRLIEGMLLGRPAGLY